MKLGRSFLKENISVKICEIFANHRLTFVCSSNCYIEREGEVGVEAGEEHEEGSDEVIDGGGARVGRHEDADNVDQSHDRPAQVLKNNKSTMQSQFQCNFHGVGDFQNRPADRGWPSVE